MIIKYNRQNVHYMELITHHKNQLDDKGRQLPISPELANLNIKRTHIHLLPGVIEITEDEWKVIKFHNPDLIASGVIEEVKARTISHPGKPSKEAKTLEEVPVKTARELVAECNDLATLQRWQGDPRADIRSLVDKKIKEIFKKEGKDESNMPDLLPADDEDVTPPETSTKMTRGEAKEGKE